MDEIIRNNFKQLRNKIGVTQEQMADFLGLEQSSICKFENGERSISVSNLEKACDLFGVEVESIYEIGISIKSLSPSFRKTDVSLNSLKDISEINKLALNIIEMDKILDENNG
ncbi:MAG: helix-turn-helix transcriptional regulator [Bacillales bacterium]|nr:helix-turn-helix transcriptional regulator [Bacillales bacterium]